jgi:predicted RNA-binding Zn ribbon-like protein
MDATEADAAPGALDLLRVFVNTLDYPDGADQLGTPQQAAEWCRRHGLPLVTNQRDTERLRAFREALRELLFANNGAADAAEAWEWMRPFLASARFALALGPAYFPALEPAGSAAGRTISALLAIVYEAVGNGTFARLRACRKSTCRFAYYDRSKNGSRAWCSMAVCGNREKAQRRRSREHDARA